MSNVIKTINVGFRKPQMKDGASMWALVRDSGTLDLNSAYLYLLLTEHFADTCVIAENEQGMIGFVSAYRPPARNSVLFVWQIAVAEAYRGQGLASRLLHTLLSQNDDVQYIEATISQGNQASIALFSKLSNDLSASCNVSEGFEQRLFPDPTHEAECLYRIGPLHLNRHK